MSRDGFAWWMIGCRIWLLFGRRKVHPKPLRRGAPNRRSTFPPITSTRAAVVNPKQEFAERSKNAPFQQIIQSAANLPLHAPANAEGMARQRIICRHPLGRGPVMHGRNLVGNPPVVLAGTLGDARIRHGATPSSGERECGRCCLRRRCNDGKCSSSPVLPALCRWSAVRCAELRPWLAQVPWRTT